jgi:hypothetical protein
MSKRRINIDRLEIRLQGIAAETARAAVSDLGQDLLAQLSSPMSFSTRTRHTRVARIEPDLLRVPSGVRPHELRSAIAERVANSIRSKLK